ncbi:uncharacterized protein LOC114517818 [Dendronephthya gigantea]|uniref:uncharacterized protein LOC114517818 n=1 Tax=Dendronephthya gigantea TaxID=151771 RepID=UPI00106C8138|nr:uncharacterized protein LOC114517818 [Dendronephthya gigantea]
MSFTLYMFESDYKGITDFVLGYTNIETGGDLFGLWKANGDPVVQLIIGPGQKSRRTSVSFHQDTDYLARVGTYVNTNFMLCHIGSWHSHHQLSLKQPSAGDRSTVCNNFPQGLKRYIMIIANITRDRHRPVAIHPFMFTNGGHVCKEGSVKLIREQNPFLEYGYVLHCIDQGKERPVATSNAYSSAAPAGYHNRPSTQSKLGVDSKQHQSQHDNRIYTKHQNFFSTDDDSAGRHSPMDIDPPMDTDPEMDTDQPHNHYITRQQQTNHSQYHDKNSKQLDNSETKQWYETEKGGAIVKEIHEEVTNKMASNIDYHRDANTKDLTMKFHHAHKSWSVLFPKSFANKPAVITNETSGKSMSSKSILQDVREMCHCVECGTIPRNNDPRSPLLPHPSSSRRDPSPSKRDPSISRRDPSPSRRDTSPSKRYPSPPKRYPSPSKQDSSPSRRDPSPSRRDPSPSKGYPSPSKQETSPFKRDFSSTTYHSPPSTPTKQDRHSDRHRPYPTKSASRPRTGRKGQDPSQPWYNTASGKAILDKIKTELSAYLRSTTCSGRVKTQDTDVSKKLSFYHSSQDWVVEFFNNPYKEVKVTFHGNKTKTLIPPYDVVSVLKNNCLCPECRPRKRSPSAGRRQTSTSRHARINQPSPTRVSSTPSPTFFASGKGEKQFQKIYTGIETLSEKDVDIQRLIDSRKIEVKFEHNRRKWKVIFPFKFPEEAAVVQQQSTRVYSRQNVNHFIPVEKGDVLRAIRKDCGCRSCKRYQY